MRGAPSRHPVHAQPLVSRHIYTFGQHLSPMTNAQRRHGRARGARGIHTYAKMFHWKDSYWLRLLVATPPMIITPTPTPPRSVWREFSRRFLPRVTPVLLLPHDPEPGDDPTPRRVTSIPRNLLDEQPNLQGDTLTKDLPLVDQYRHRPLVRLYHSRKPRVM